MEIIIMLEEKFKDEYGIPNLAMIPQPCGFCISFPAFFYIYDRSKYFLLKKLKIKRLSFINSKPTVSR